MSEVRIMNGKWNVFDCLDDNTVHSNTPLVPPHRRPDAAAFKAWDNFYSKYPTFCSTLLSLSDHPDPTAHCASLISKTRKRAATWLLKTIDGVYDSFWSAHLRYQQKASLDLQDSSILTPPSDIPSFSVDYIRRTLGIDKLVLENCIEFMINLDRYRVNEADIELFGNFFEQFYSVDALLMILSARNVCGKVRLGGRIPLVSAVKAVKHVFKERGTVSQVVDRVKKAGQKQASVAVSVFNCIILENLSVQETSPSRSPQSRSLSPLVQSPTYSNHSPVQSSHSPVQSNQPEDQKSPLLTSQTLSFADRVKQLQQSQNDLKMLENQKESDKDDDSYDSDEFLYQEDDDNELESHVIDDVEEEHVQHEAQSPHQLDNHQSENAESELIDIDPDEVDAVSDALDALGCKSSRHFATLFLSKLEETILNYLQICIDSALQHLKVSASFIEPILSIAHPQIKTAVAPLIVMITTQDQIEPRLDHSGSCNAHLAWSREILRQSLVCRGSDLEEMIELLCKSLLACPDVRNLVEPSVAFILTNLSFDSKSKGSPSLLYKSKELHVPVDDSQYLET
ncbi:hypothetical protein GEMRC1_000912 [Eukaryota sp. GEM-RC1]